MADAVGRLRELLARALQPLPGQVRADVEQELEASGSAVLLMHILSDRTYSCLEVRQLAGVVLARRLPQHWHDLPHQTQTDIEQQLLQLLPSMHEAQVIGDDTRLLRTVAECAWQVARSRAMASGAIWQGLLDWLRAVGVACHKCHSSGRPLPEQLGKVFLYLLERLGTCPPWQAILRPSTPEILQLLSDMVTSGLSAPSELAKDAALSLGSVSRALVQGEDLATYSRRVLEEVLLSQAVLQSDVMCEAALEALALAAGSDELLVADPGCCCYQPLQKGAPAELCGVVRLALIAAVQHKGRRRELGLRLLHSIADSHARLLVVVDRRGKLSAEAVVLPLIEMMAASEIACAGDEQVFAFGSAVAEWGEEYAVLSCMARRLPDRLMLPPVYRCALRAYSDDSKPPAARIASLSALRAIMPYCGSLVRKHLSRVAKLVLRTLADMQLHFLSFAVVADLFSIAPAEARCGSMRLRERVLMPLLAQMQAITAHDVAYPQAIAALEAACKLSHAGTLLALKPPQSGIVLATWLAARLQELVNAQAVTAEDQLRRLCALLTAVVQHHTRDIRASPGLHASLTAGLRLALVKTQSTESRGAVLITAGAMLSYETQLPQGSAAAIAQQELLRGCLQLLEVGLCTSKVSTEAAPAVSAEDASRFIASLGPGGQARIAAAGFQMNKVLSFAFERLAEEPSTGLLLGLADVVSPSAGAVLGKDFDKQWPRLVPLLVSCLSDSGLRRSAGELAQWLPLNEASAHVVGEIARLLLVEEHIEVLVSLCRAALRLAAQANGGKVSVRNADNGECGAMAVALYALARAAKELPTRSLERGGGTFGDDDEELSDSDTSSLDSHASAETALTVASTVDLEDFLEENELIYRPASGRGQWRPV